MKGKKILALASIFAGVALVGSTFAAWAITDNADPFGLKLSPNTISADTDTKYVTLSYGQKYAENISNIESGKTYLAAKVQLLADTSNGDTYTGRFNVSLINQTEKASGKLLVNYLSVNVYTVEGEITDPLASVSQGTDITSTSLTALTKKTQTPITTTATDVSITCTDNVAKQTYVTVTLQSNLDASTLADIHDDVVYLQMNWNSEGAQGELTATKVYFKYSASGKKAYAFAWTSAKVNQAYPGALMEDEGNGLYSYNLNTEYSNILFVVKDTVDGPEVAKTGDLTISTLQRQTTPCFTYNADTATTKGSWTVVPESLVDGWYAVGTFNSWTPSASTKLTAVSENEFKLENVQLEAGAKVKVRDASGANWRGADHIYDDCGYASVDGDGNAVIGAAGVYTIHFYSNSADGNYISFTK